MTPFSGPLGEVDRDFLLIMRTGSVESSMAWLQRLSNSPLGRGSPQRRSLLVSHPRKVVMRSFARTRGFGFSADVVRKRGRAPASATLFPARQCTFSNEICLPAVQGGEMVPQWLPSSCSASMAPLARSLPKRCTASLRTEWLRPEAFLGSRTTSVLKPKFIHAAV